MQLLSRPTGISLGGPDPNSSPLSLQWYSPVVVVLPLPSSVPTVVLCSIWSCPELAALKWLSALLMLRRLHYVLRQLTLENYPTCAWHARMYRIMVV